MLERFLAEMASFSAMRRVFAVRLIEVGVAGHLGPFCCLSAQENQAWDAGSLSWGHRRSE
ncbi:hypothetical protein [Pseudomonas sp. PH1b]|uniref:hypothetical protein n=1 Tax=Pseudomonas sp. PH1b TaxID=1397282 RepID=UPI000ADFE736|nr:hypothetical protein [Pseudomonas sp. PH1b]